MAAFVAEQTVSVTSSVVPNEHNAAVPQTKYNITFGTDINIHLHSRRIAGSPMTVPTKTRFITTSDMADNMRKTANN